MLLAVAATEIEMAPFRDGCSLSGGQVTSHISGVGPVETAISLSRFLEQHHKNFRIVVNFGIGGAYLGSNPEGQLQVGEICLAEREVFGDYGVSFGDRTEPFGDPTLGGPTEFMLDGLLLEQAGACLRQNNIEFRQGTFVTVCGASGTAARGGYLHNRYQALCENMEGAAVARVCGEFNLPLLELRAISNLVEDRPGKRWQIGEASRLAALTTARLCEAFQVIL